MSTAVRAARPRPALRTATPTAVWGLCALQLLLALAWSVAVPTLRAPDEPAHVDLARHLADGGAYPEPGGLALSRQMVAAAQRAQFSEDAAVRPERNVRFRAEDVRPGHARPSFAALGEAGRPSGVTNPAAQQPPLWPALAAAVLTMLPDTTSYDVQVWLLRALGAAGVAALPWCGWTAGRWLVDDQRALLAAAAAPLAIPALAHAAASAGPHGLTAALGGAYTVGLARLVAGDARLRTSILIGLAGGLGMLASPYALAWVLALPVAVAVAVRGGWLRWSPAVAGAGYAVALAAVVGGWWYPRNLARFGDPQPLVGPFWDAVGDPVGVGDWIVSVVTLLPQSFWGRFGFAEAALPWPVVALLSAAGVVAVAAALLGRRAPATGLAPSALALLAPVVGTLVVVVVVAARLYAATDVPVGLHGADLYGGLVGLATVAGAGACALAGWWARWLPAGLLAVAVAVHGLGGWQVLHTWWGPADEATTVVSLRAMLAWAPLPPRALAVLALMTLITVATVGWALVTQSRIARPAPRALAGRRQSAD